ncbi:MAG: flagellar basal body P-ring protein FlgI [Phycisphaerae bacterium]
MRMTSMALMALSLLAGLASAERVKDIVQIKGQRGNSLIGYGVVVGLRGTGDSSLATRRAYASYLARYEGIKIDPNDVEGKNLASVIVTAELPPFSRRDTTIDITVAAVSAGSLAGGQLLRTELKGADGQVYALAKGQLIIGGFTAQGERASVVRNHPTVGTIPNGASVEREELAEINENGKLTLQLINPDYTTAVNIASAINSLYHDVAHALDKGAVQVRIPADIGKEKLATFVHSIGGLQVEVDAEAVVILNERTGTVVVGKDVTISTVALSHGSLTIVTKETEKVVQPNPFSQTGDTETERDTQIGVFEGPGRLHVLAKPDPLTVSMLARSLNALGVSPTDLVAIFKALHDQGALQAKLVTTK